MTTFDLENPEPITGDELRDEAANLLSTKYGRPLKEHRVNGKKSDLYFVRKDFGKDIKIYVEAKDEARILGRHDVNLIWSDYSGIIANSRPSQLLLITQWFAPVSKAELQRLLEPMRYGAEQINSNAQRLKQESLLIETENHWITNTEVAESKEICEQAMSTVMPEVLALMELL